MKKKMFSYILMLLSVLWIIFIFSNSLENAEESGEKSSWVYSIVSKVFPNITIFVIRKLAHFTEFAILGVLFASTYFSFTLPRFFQAPKTSLYSLLAMPAIFAIACTDETLQRFSEGRHSAFSDVLIDSAGGICGIAAVLALIFIMRYFHIKK